MDLSITTLKLKDMAIMQTHIIPLLRKNNSGNNIFNQPAFTTFLKLEQLLVSIIHDKNYKNKLAYVQSSRQSRLVQGEQLFTTNQVF